jgi:hypothetical protein
MLLASIGKCTSEVANARLCVEEQRAPRKREKTLACLTCSLSEATATLPAAFSNCYRHLAADRLVGFKNEETDFHTFLSGRSLHLRYCAAVVSLNSCLMYMPLLRFVYSRCIIALLAICVSLSTTCQGLDKMSCSVAGCTRVDAGNGKCVSHGGGKRCQAPGCTKGAQVRSQQYGNC